MKIASVTEIKARLSAYLRDSEQDPVVVTRDGRPVAVILGIHNEDELERLLLADSPKLRSILGAARARIEAGEGIPSDDFWNDLSP